MIVFPVGDHCNKCRVRLNPLLTCDSYLEPGTLGSGLPLCVCVCVQQGLSLVFTMIGMHRLCKPHLHPILYIALEYMCVCVSISASVSFPKYFSLSLSPFLSLSHAVIIFKSKVLQFE